MEAVCVGVCMCVLEPRRAGLTAVVRHLMQMLGIELWLSLQPLLKARAAVLRLSTRAQQGERMSCLALNTNDWAITRGCCFCVLANALET